MLELDIATDYVRLGQPSVVVRGKDAQLLLQLIVIAPEQWLFADDVHNLPAWRGMLRESVGKQVARFIDTLVTAGHDIVEWQHKTKSWRLRPELLLTLPTWAKVQAAGRLTVLNHAAWARFGSVPVAEMADWALAAVQAVMAMGLGKPATAWQCVRAARGHSKHPDLQAITDVLASRVGQRMPQPHQPVSPLLAASPFERVVSARHIAALALHAPSQDWPALLARLLDVLADPAVAGDLTSRALLLNAIAMLERRLHQPDGAMAHASEALPLAVFSGDLMLMQAVMFNLGNILSEQARRGDDTVPAALPVRLLETDVLIREAFALGRDSAQAELLLAYLALEQGRRADVAAWLAKAAQLIDISRSTPDLALHARIRGLLALTENSASSEGLAALDESARLFRHIGNQPAADHVAAERAAFAKKAASTQG